MRAVVMNGAGGRETLEYVERPDPVAGPGEALIEIAFAGVNFMDIGARQGTVWTEFPDPKILGVEAPAVSSPWGTTSKASHPVTVSHGCMRPEATPSRSQSQPHRWCRFPTRSTTVWPHPS